MPAYYQFQSKAAMAAHKRAQGRLILALEIALAIAFMVFCLGAYNLFWFAFAPLGQL